MYIYAHSEIKLITEQSQILQLKFLQLSKQIALPSLFNIDTYYGLANYSC